MNTDFLKPIRKSMLPSMIGLLLAQAANADTTLTVTSLADSGPGTLREALSVPNDDNDDHHTISFDSALHCTAETPCTIGLLAPLSYYGKSVAISGPGSDALTLDSSANPNAIALSIADSGTTESLDFSLSGIKIANTKTDINDWNTTIRSDGIDTLTFTDVWFDHNKSESLVVIDGEEVTLDRCIFTNNGRGASIGANRIAVTDSVFNFNTVDSLHLSDFDAATIDRSAFYQNESGIISYATRPDSLTVITNSTIVGSSDRAIGAAFAGSGERSELRLVHSTVVGNAGLNFAGLLASGYDGTVRLIDSIISDNACTEDGCSPDVSGRTKDPDRPITIESSGFNLIEFPDPYVSPQTSDITGQSSQTVCDSPSNSTTTTAVTCTPSGSSPAINKVPIVNGSCNATNVVVDQLGTVRPQNNKCEMGAIEVKMRGSRR
jgi:hypothetical protein